MEAKTSTQGFPTVSKPVVTTPSNETERTRVTTPRQHALSTPMCCRRDEEVDLGGPSGPALPGAAPLRGESW